MVIATHPGRHGDILWALPTVRALAEGYGEPVHLRLSAKYGSEAFCQLLRQQDYLASVEALSDWQIDESAPITPRVPPAHYGDGWHDTNVHLYHLGYAGWPHPTLPEDVWRRVREQYDAEQVGQMWPGEFPPLDLTQPWLTTPAAIRGLDVAIGFTDEHFELKFGVTTLLLNAEDGAPWIGMVLAAPGSRWAREACHVAQSWQEAAEAIAIARVFFGCCSALHVLAVGLGTPCVILEPNPQRGHDTFWPLGKDGRVQLVRGGDGQPTWDSRHCAEAIADALGGAGGGR